MALSLECVSILLFADFSRPQYLPNDMLSQVVVTDWNYKGAHNPVFGHDYMTARLSLLFKTKLF